MDYQLSNGKIQVTVSDVGAELQSIRKEGTEYLWNGDAAYWNERSPILFPYVGRFTEGKYFLSGKEYEMDIHGFARKLPYHVVYREEDMITFELRDNEETYQMYPYHFIFQVTYELNEQEIVITYRVSNCTKETMYFGIGGHPGFMVPLEDRLEFSDYYLEFNGAARPERIGHTPACFLSGTDTEFPLEGGRRLKLAHNLFDDDAIVLRNMADEVTLGSEKGSRKVKVSYPDMPYLGIWHAPKTDAPYVCIEPWTSLPSRQDVVEELKYKSDLIRLTAGEQYVNMWSIAVV